jgi:indole-3-glycerol phosphate synthase
MTSKGAEQGILDRIVEARLVRIEEAKRLVSLADVKAKLGDAPAVTSFRGALEAKPGIAVIAEMKRSSPSAGQLDATLDPAMRASVYCKAGAAAISVLTEQDFFNGAIADMEKARRVAGPASVAILRKDFVVDEYQVYEARVAGADAVLLIIAILEPAKYRDLLQLIEGLGMDALVEVFDQGELDIALKESPDIVGVNNRNLKTLETSLTVFERLAPAIPATSLKVAESGMRNASDVARMGRAGAKAALVGESLMRAGEDAGALVKAMSKAQVG